MTRDKPGASAPRAAAWAAVSAAMLGAPMALAATCQVQSGATVAPVVELYTSQGCSSCPPADRWLSRLRPGSTAPEGAVIQAFHVAYWDYIGWPDPFAAPAHTARQRQIAAWNGLRSIYTPQVVLDGRDWRQWRNAPMPLAMAGRRAGASIRLVRGAPDRFDATVTLERGGPDAWAAYWTVTDSAHHTAVGAGENAGETLRNDHVVRQYTLAGHYRGQPGTPQPLVLHAVPAAAGHARTVNLVVFDPRNGDTVQAVSLACQQQAPSPGAAAPTQPGTSAAQTGV